MPAKPLSFDPSYGHTLESLLRIEPPPEPEGFEELWTERYRRALAVDPAARLGPIQARRCGWTVREFTSVSTGDFPLRGWLLAPEGGEVRRAFVVGHGYGGREAPDYHLPMRDAALLFPCARGLGLSRCATIPEDPMRHVLHRIEDPQRYVLGDCAEDIWTATTALLQWFPEAAGQFSGFLRGAVMFSGFLREKLLAIRPETPF